MAGKRKSSSDDSSATLTGTRRVSLSSYVRLNGEDELRRPGDELELEATLAGELVRQGQAAYLDDDPAA